MQVSAVIVALLGLGAVGYMVAYQRSRLLQTPAALTASAHSLPRHYGAMTGIWCCLPALLLLLLWTGLESSVVRDLVVAGLPAEVRALDESELGLYYNQVVGHARSPASGFAPSPEQRAAAEHYRSLIAASRSGRALLVLLLAVAGGLLALRRVRHGVRARTHVEAVVEWMLFGCSFLAVLTTLGIVFSVLFEAIRFFRFVAPTEFLFGLHWSPQTAIRVDQVAAEGAFGFVPLLTGTLLIALVAMLIAVPVGLMSAIYLAEYASRGFRSVAKPVLEVLAGVPTVVYGFFAALTVAPMIRSLGEGVGLDVASESALAAGLVMGIMIIPFVMSLTDDMLNAVPDSLREASLGMGATRSETVRLVLVPAALPGIVGGILLAVSRAIGETMIVVMAAGLSARLTANPLEAVTTITVQIVTLLVGDQEFDSPKTLAAFALGLVLFFLTLGLNVLALFVVRRYREQYE